MGIPHVEGEHDCVGGGVLPLDDGVDLGPDVVAHLGAVGGADEVGEGTAAGGAGAA